MLKEEIITFNEVLSLKFAKYSKYIIQDRAIPDARDGLKPGQRRIIYAMFKNNNIASKPYRKSAKTVGDVIGSFHPHGDSSIYEALVRMSQWWKLRYPLIDMHGNNGSIDNDSAAAMRYTESRLSKISQLLVDDIEKETVNWTLNFDDTILEPCVLPSKFPNLLLNGSSGIASGYATDIPPHNLEEIFKALIFKIHHPNCSFKELQKIIKGPDFPTGGIIVNNNDFKKIFETGKGKVTIRCKSEIVQTSTKTSIVISEIPYGVSKTNLVVNVENFLKDKLENSFLEIRDESYRQEIKIVIDFAKDTDCQKILSFLFQKTLMQIYYNYNMTSIVNKKPMLIGIGGLLDEYLKYQTNILVKKLEFIEKKLKKRNEILNGMLKILNSLDIAISIIRKSKSKAESKLNLESHFDLTKDQSEAIVNLKLYQLTSTDLLHIREELNLNYEKLNNIWKILGSETEINNQLEKNFLTIIDQFKDKRRTKIINEEFNPLIIKEEDLLKNEESIVTFSKDGYVKRTSLKSFRLSKIKEVQIDEKDLLLLQKKTMLLNHIVIFLKQGIFLNIPIYKIPETKWKEKGIHFSSLLNNPISDVTINVMIIHQFDDKHLVIGTKDGIVKKIKLESLQKIANWKKPYTYITLNSQDKVVNVEYSDNDFILFMNNLGFVNKFFSSDINASGLKTKGIKGINLIGSNYVVNMTTGKQEDMVLFITNKNTAKRILIHKIPIKKRFSQGSRINKIKKTNPQSIIFFCSVNLNTILYLISTFNIEKIMAKEIPLLNQFDGNNKFIQKSFIIKEVKKNFTLLPDISSQITKKIENKELNSKDEEVLKNQSLFDIINEI